LAKSWTEGKEAPDGGDVLEDDGAPPEAADDPAPPVPIAGPAAVGFPLGADKPDDRPMCATGATDRNTVPAVAGIKKTKARKPVIRTVGIKSSFFA